MNQKPIQKIQLYVAIFPNIALAKCHFHHLNVQSTSAT